MVAAVLAAVLLSGAAQADRREDRGVWDVEYGPVRLATVRLGAVQENGRYAVAGAIDSVGLVSALRRFRFEARAEGRVAPDGSLRPVSYAEEADTGRRATRTELAYADGVPLRLVAEPAAEFGPDLVDPATQGGTIDILTALYQLLRAQPEAEACTLSAALYDGRRRSLVRVTSREVLEGGGVRCTGEFRRLQGFSEDDLRRHASFAFDGIYLPGPDGLLRPGDIRLETVFGAVRVVPREGCGAAVC